MKKLMSLIKKLRILETSFTTIHEERKTHYLLTYTPESEPMADEKYQLTFRQIQELFDSIEEANNEFKRLKSENRKLRKELKLF